MACPLKNINDLSDEHLCYIFSYLPVELVLRLDKVCVRWCWLKLLTCEQRRRLTLMVGHNAIGLVTGGKFAFQLMHTQAGAPFVSSLLYATEWSRLTLADLSESLIWWLDTTFPLVHTLNVSFRADTLAQLDLLPRLIDQWSNRLVNFKVWLGYGSSSICLASCRKKLVESINSCTGLRHLTLHLCGSLFLNTSRTIPSLKLSILGQLDSFDFYSDDHEYLQMVTNALKANNVPKSKLRRVGLSTSIGISKDNLAELFQIDNQVASKVVHLDIIGRGLARLSNHVKLCAKFGSLTTLVMRLVESSLGPLSMHQLLRNFDQLRHLLYLKIDLLGDFDLVNRPQPYHRLRSVKALSLSFASKCHTELQSFHLDWTFPNMQSIEILLPSHSCSTCGYKKALTRTDLQPRRQCTEKLFKPLKRIEHLQKRTLCILTANK